MKVTTVVTLSVYVLGVRTLNVALFLKKYGSIDHEIIHAKSTSEMQKINKKNGRELMS